MNIGIDIDDVTADFINPLLRFYHQRTGIRLSYENFFSYRFEDVWGGTRIETISFVREFYHSDAFAKLPLIEGAEEGLNLLSERHSKVFITSRHSKAKEVTPKWIEYRLPKLQGNRIIFSGEYAESSDGSKGDISVKEGLDLIVEDNGDIALDCSEKGIVTILFNRPWNQGVTHSNILRVKNWQEALREIEALDGYI